MANEWTHVLTIPESSVRLGTLVRLGVALGWDLDDLLVRGQYSKVELWRRSDAVADRPPVLVLAGQEASDEWASASRPWEVFDRRTGQPLPEVEPLADGDAAPLDTPLAAFDEAMAAKAEPAPIADDATVAEVMAATNLPLTRYCRQCGREFVSKPAARSHEVDDHSRPDAITCEDCGWLFTTQRGINHHAVMKHGAGYARPPVPDDTPAPIERRPFDPEAARQRAAEGI